MKSKIVIAGGTGFLGQYLYKKYKELDYDIIIISRQKNHIQWNESDRIIEALNSAEALINLAGKSVNCRYNEATKKEILDSRIETTKILGNAIAQCSIKPKIWMNASTATIYRHSEDKAMTEESTEYGNDFSCSIAKSWEEAFSSFSFSETRQIALRTTIVFGEKGALPEYKKLVHMGLGGVQGNGKQMVSWIHIEDFFRAILFIQQHSDISHIVNVAAPNPITNKHFMQALRNVMRKNFGLSTPEWILKIGAAIKGTETELILKSRWVVPEKLLKNGFEFEYPTIEKALNNLIKDIG